MALEGDKYQAKEILLLPFFGQGHLYPFIELLKHLSFLHFSATLLLPSSLSFAIIPSLRHLIEVVETPSSASLLHPPPGPGPFGGPHEQLAQRIESLVAGRSVRPICAVVDIMMSWAHDVFKKMEIPIVALFTYGACSAAIEYGSWMAHVSDLGPGETRDFPGLPEEMAVSYFDLKREAHHPPHGGPPPTGTGYIFPHGPPKPGNKGFGGPPPAPGERPRWVDEVDGTIGIMMNTCRELEGPFLDYIANQINKQVWGVGPLLPEEYWKTTGSLVHDNEIRANKQSNYSEEEVNQWLDSKPHGSVLYISFGSEVGPTFDECTQLARALEESKWPFIWVIQPRSGSRRPDPPPHIAGPGLEEDYFSHDLESKVGDRGVVIVGWAPQLLILSHPSTGGLLSHCGWNSTVEAIGQGVPLLAWPIRGDQHHNAKLAVKYLEVGYMIKENKCSSSFEIVKEDIVGGIQKLMSDHGIKQRANMLQSKFKGGFPASSKAALDDFIAFVVPNKASA